jgi:hypothetical protein
MTSGLVSLLAEGAAHESVPAPILVGGTAFVGFLIALFIVTRLNKDR